MQDQWADVLGRVHVVPITDIEGMLAWLADAASWWRQEAAAAGNKRTPHLLVLDSVAAVAAPILSASGCFHGEQSRRSLTC